MRWESTGENFMKILKVYDLFSLAVFDSIISAVFVSLWITKITKNHPISVIGNQKHWSL